MKWYLIKLIPDLMSVNQGIEMAKLMSCQGSKMFIRE